VDPGPRVIDWVVRVSVVRWSGFPVASRGVSGRVCLEEGFTLRAAVTLLHSLPIVAPFLLRALRAPLHSRSSAFCRRSRHGLASPSRAFPVRGGTRPGAQPARMERAGVRRKDLRRCHSPRRSHCRRVRALHLLCNAPNFGVKFFFFLHSPNSSVTSLFPCLFAKPYPFPKLYVV
jgi:hypothetical protein